MTSPAKRKGDSAELEAARLLADLTGWPVRRKLGAGRLDDTGDLDGIPDSVCQVKNYRDITRAINEVLAELPAQQANAGADYAFGLVRRPGGRWFAVLDLDNLCALLREATYPMAQFSWKRCERCGIEQRPATMSDDGEICNACARELTPNHPTRRALRQRAGLE